jgi:hypothetical protein
LFTQKPADGDAMIAWDWMEMQVLSLTVAERKAILGRQRLKLTTERLLEYLKALVQQQIEQRHFSLIYAAQPRSMAYNSFMHGVGIVAKLLGWLEQRFRIEHHLGFDAVTIADSSLLPSKEAKSITAKDWEQQRATVRPAAKTAKTQGDAKLYIAGEKWMTALNSQGFMVYSRLMDHINVADVHMFRHPMAWYRLGLGRRSEVNPHPRYLIVDRGFSDRKMRSAFEQFSRLQPKFRCQVVSPYHYKEKRSLSPEEWCLYQQRWAIETSYQRIKDPLGEFRLTMRGVRRRSLRAARIALVTLAWNMQRWEELRR